MTPGEGGESAERAQRSPSPSPASVVWRRGRSFAEATAREFLADHGPQLAAAIAYWVLVSIFPLAILLVAVAGLFLRDASAASALVDALLANVPLSSEGRAELEQLLADVATGSPALTVLGSVALVWTASGLMTTVRTALNVVWDTSEARPFLRGKLLDVALVLAVGVFVALSVTLTLAVRVLTSQTERLAAAVGAPDVSGALRVGLELVLPFALSFLALAVVYHVVPATRPPLRAVWPAAALGALAFEAAKHVLAVYFENFANYTVVYGSIGAVVAFLVFVYLSSNVFLVSAEAAAELARRRQHETGGGQGRGRSARTALSSTRSP